MSDAGQRARTLAAVTGGIVIGFTLAAAAFALVARWPWSRERDEVAWIAPSGDRLDVFRLPSTPGREMFLVPAGPDGTGEPRLSAALFPGEKPPRALASLLLANLSRDDSWEVDLAAAPIRCRASAGEEWRAVSGLGRAMAARAGVLAASDALRLRALGAGEDRVVVGPSSLRQVLLALPPGRRIADLSDVQWGTTPLVRDAIELERVRRFREDPAAATMGR